MIRLFKDNKVITISRKDAEIKVTATWEEDNQTKEMKDSVEDAKARIKDIIANYVKLGWKKVQKGEWVITKDHIGDDSGIMGPSGCTMTAEEVQRFGTHFKMFDDDGELYYEGYCVENGGEEGFAPLEDFGEPGAGCTGIKYRSKDGTYSWL